MSATDLTSSFALAAQYFFLTSDSFRFSASVDFIPNIQLNKMLIHGRVRRKENAIIQALREQQIEVQEKYNIILYNKSNNFCNCWFYKVKLGDVFFHEYYAELCTRMS